MKANNRLIDALPQLVVFAKTVECGSFKKAAFALELSPSVISYHVSQLEKHLKIALLYRTTRSLSLTNEGKKIYKHAQRILNEVENSFNAVPNTSAAKSGALSITLPAVMVQHPIFKKISQFCQANPLVKLDIQVTDQRINLIEQGIDLAIRIGALGDNQASLKQKKLTQINRLLVGGIKLVQNHRQPTAPKDLESWPWIGLNMLAHFRKLTNNQGKQHKLSFQPHIVVDSVDAMTELVKQNAGIATPPDYLINQAITKSQAIQLLPSWAIEPLNVYTVWPSNTHKTSLSHYLIDYLHK